MGKVRVPENVEPESAEESIVLSPEELELKERVEAVEYRELMIQGKENNIQGRLSEVTRLEAVACDTVKEAVNQLVMIEGYSEQRISEVEVECTQKYHDTVTKLQQTIKTEEDAHKVILKGLVDKINRLNKEYIGYTGYFKKAMDLIESWPYRDFFEHSPRAETITKACDVLAKLSVNNSIKFIKDAEDESQSST
jgi:hypothetical protein